MTFEDSKLAFLPGFWYDKFLNCKYPQPIMSAHLMCEHKKIKPDYFDCFPPKQNKNSTNPFLNENSMMEGSMCVDF